VDTLARFSAEGRVGQGPFGYFNLGPNSRFGFEGFASVAR
jgi:hypothetical protein